MIKASPITCTACKGTTILLGEKFHAMIYRCCRCGSLIADCDEPKEDFYEQEYFGGSDYGYLDGAHATTHIHTLDAASHRRVSKLRGFRKIIEIGAGNGSFVKAGTNAGLNIVGIERSRHMRLIAKDYFDVSLHRVVSIVKERPFAVVFIEVIEHVKNPNNFLKQIFSDLKEQPNFMLFTTPNAEASELLGISWEQIKPPEHVNLFTANGLKAILESHGYHALHFHYYHSVFLDLSIRKLGSRSNRKVPILWILSSFLRWIDAPLCKILPGRFALGLECYCAR